MQDGHWFEECPRHDSVVQIEITCIPCKPRVLEVGYDYRRDDHSRRVYSLCQLTIHLRLINISLKISDTSQMATLFIEDKIGDHHLKSQDLVTPKAQEYARNTHFEPTIEERIHQGHEWKIS